MKKDELLNAITSILEARKKQIGGLSQDQIGGLSQDQIGWLSNAILKAIKEKLES